MTVQDELLLQKAPSPGHELALSILLTRELLMRLLDDQVFRGSGTTDPQFNILRILKGGPTQGYTIGDLRRRVIFRNADVPRLVDRMAAAGLVQRLSHPQDRRSCLVQLAPGGQALLERVSPRLDQAMEDLEGLLSPMEGREIVEGLNRLRAGLQRLVDAG